jgi:hypothetical protein
LGDVPHEKLDDPLYDEYLLRDAGERKCLMLVDQLIRKFGHEKLVAAGFVERWLAKQPWGDTVEERRKNFSQYLSRRKNRLADICFHIRSSRVGSKALADAKLIVRTRKSKRDRSEQIKVVLEISMSDENDPSTIQVEATHSELVPRVVDQSAEEQRLRRRHREAMVLNDGTHSLGRGDIIQREHDPNN